MIFALVLLATIDRCASPTLCLSDEQLIAAVRSRDAADIQAISNAEQEKDPDSIVMIHSERIKGIKDVVCGDLLTESPRSMNCSFTIRYWSSDAIQIAKLSWQANDWVITERMVVTRHRK